jgi:hypothetical protein
MEIKRAKGWDYFDVPVKTLTLVRVTNLSEIMGRDVTREHQGPSPGGKFWALYDAHDLPYSGARFLFVSLEDLLKVRRGFMRDAEKKEEWIEVHSLDDIPVFSTGINEDYEGCSFSSIVSPYTPEFYLVKKGEMK